MSNTESVVLYSLGQLQCDDSLRLSFYALSPKFELGVDGTMKDKILLETLSMKGTYWRVMANLLRHPSEAQILPEMEKNIAWTT